MRILKPIVVKAGSETPDPLSGMSYPVPKCLKRIGHHCKIVVTEDEDEQTLIEAGMPTLKAIIKMGTGIDSIDFAAAREYGVRVANCPSYARHAVAGFLNMDNVVISPHLAAWTVETWDRLQDEVSVHVINVLPGRDLVIHSNDLRLANQAGCIYPESR